MIDLEWIRRLIDMTEKSELDTVEVSRFGTRVRLSKSPPIQMVGGVAPAPGAMVAESASSTAGDDAAPRESATELFEAKSPMVGTFYRAPSPDAPAYVEVGDPVRQGQTLCILEAMKLMNELESETSGIIREICVGNAEPVEFGQVLFRIEPEGSS